MKIGLHNFLHVKQHLKRRGANSVFGSSFSLGLEALKPRTTLPPSSWRLQDALAPCRVIACERGSNVPKSSKTAGMGPLAVQELRTVSEERQTKSPKLLKKVTYIQNLALVTSPGALL